MTIKSDKWIRKMSQEHGMIQPFEDRLVRVEPRYTGMGNVEDKKIISYGLSSYGYDVRIADDFKIFTNVNNAIVDPKKFDESAFVDFKGDICIIPPNSFVLGYSVEKLKIPEDVLCVCIGKSSMARCGLIVNVTPLEPMWLGNITIEISNTTPLPAKVYANEGIAQILFFQSDEVCETNYEDRQGKYQNQGPEVVIPRL